MKKINLAYFSILVSFLSACQPTDINSITLYTSRQPQLIEPMLEEYTKLTGIKVNVLGGDAQQLLERIDTEKNKTEADLFMTVDAGVLWQAAERGIFAPVNSTSLQENIPSYLRDEENLWFGLAKRLRTIVYNTDLVLEPPLSYEELSTPKWKNQLCLRTSQKVYNQSLIASMIDRMGADATQSVLEGWVSNLATPVFSSDTKALEAVSAGQCSVTIVNTYYLGRLNQKEKGLNLKLIWANQETSGTHINISGAGLIKYSDNQKEAIKLLEWFASKDAQAEYAGRNLEYPVLADQPLHPLVESWGSFKEDQIPTQRLGALQKQAVMLARQSQYD